MEVGFIYFRLVTKPSVLVDMGSHCGKNPTGTSTNQLPYHTNQTRQIICTGIYIRKRLTRCKTPSVSWEVLNNSENVSVLIPRMSRKFSAGNTATA